MARFVTTLPDAAKARIERLKGRMETATCSAVVSNAAWLYEFVLNEVQAGGKLLVKRSDGTIVEVQLQAR